MTVAIGATCSEGTVLLTDSPAPLYDADRQAWCGVPDAGDTKLVVLPKMGVAFIHSGCRPAGFSLGRHWSRFDVGRVSDLRFVGACVLQPLLEMEPSPELAEELARTASKPGGRPLDLEAGREMAREHDLLLANLGAEGLRLGLMTNRSAPSAGTVHGTWVEESGYIVAGALTEWWAEQPKPDAPDSLSEARALVLDIVERFHRAKYGTPSWHFRNWKWQRGLSVEMPTCLPPYIGLTWDASTEKIHRWKVELAEDDVFLEPAPVEQAE